MSDLDLRFGSHELIEIAQKDWDRLPKDTWGIPVYYRQTAIGIELWPLPEIEFKTDPPTKLAT